MSRTREPRHAPARLLWSAVSLSVRLWCPPNQPLSIWARNSSVALPQRGAWVAPLPRPASVQALARTSWLGRSRTTRRTRMKSIWTHCSISVMPKRHSQKRNLRLPLRHQQHPGRNLLPPAPNLSRRVLAMFFRPPGGGCGWNGMWSRVRRRALCWPLNSQPRKNDCCSSTSKRRKRRKIKRRSQVGMSPMRVLIKERRYGLRDFERGCAVVLNNV
mmetsp:Transcript_2867/g.8993  ORF Transcript_2867/g.8993 Transcript_2867/m.8993 type:complete len:216 (-) Transcript_2867:331-978(-)